MAYEFPEDEEGWGKVDENADAGEDGFSGESHGEAVDRCEIDFEDRRFSASRVSGWE
jgi:hypothetical protein